MTKRFTPIWLVVLLLVVACGSDKHQLALLDGAETVMTTAPDTALALLDSIDSDRLSRADNARYALLRSQALDKNYIDVTNDSLINIAVEYYQKHRNPRYEMLAHYYNGRVKYNAQRYAHSIISFHNAQNLAHEQSDSYWLGRIAEQMAIIYDLHFYESESIEYAQISCDRLHESGKQPYINYALLRLARIHYNYDNNNECLYIAKQLLDSAYKYNDKNLEYATMRVLAKSYYGLENYHAAIEVIENLSSSGEMSNDLYAILGICHSAVGNSKEAEKIYDDIKNNATIDDALLNYQLSRLSKDDSNALLALEKLYLSVDSTLMSALNQNFSSAITEYYSFQDQLMTERMKGYKIINIISIIVCVIIIGLLIFMFTRKYQNQQARIEKNVAIAGNLSEIITLKETDIKNAQDTIKELLKSQFDTIDTLCEKYYHSRNNRKTKNNISEEVEKLINQLSADPVYINQLESLVNKHHNNLIKNFKDDLPNLKQADYLLYLYSVLGFSTTAISIILNENMVDAVYNRKARLKAKIKQLPEPKQLSYLTPIS